MTKTGRWLGLIALVVELTRPSARRSAPASGSWPTAWTGWGVRTVTPLGSRLLRAPRGRRPVVAVCRMASQRVVKLAAAMGALSVRPYGRRCVERSCRLAVLPAPRRHVASTC